jgi:hypothetical protein
MKIFKLSTAPKRLVLFSIYILVLTASTLGDQADRRDCFPFERLEPQKRRMAEELLLKALDSEALYTIVGGIKPMSSGFANFSFQIREPHSDEGRRERLSVLQKIEDTRQILALWRCGEELFAEVQQFSRAFEGRRSAEAVVFRMSSMRNMLTERSEFFQRWGITPASHSLTVLFAVENAEPATRFAGYGYLFGYPDHAVRFFVDAANEEELTGKFVERDFYSIRTFVSDTNRFVYAVPKGHRERQEDAELKRRSEAVLSEYIDRRARYIGYGKPGVLELIRDWFCDEKNKCTPSKIRY